MELVECTTVAHGKHKQQTCQVKVGVAPFTLSGHGRKLAATIKRGKRLCAKGFLIGATRRPRLLLRPRGKLATGRYTLVVKRDHRYLREKILMR